MRWAVATLLAWLTLLCASIAFTASLLPSPAAALVLLTLAVGGVVTTMRLAAWVDLERRADREK